MHRVLFSLLLLALPAIGRSQTAEEVAKAAARCETRAETVRDIAVRQRLRQLLENARAAQQLGDQAQAMSLLGKLSKALDEARADERKGAPRLLKSTSTLQRSLQRLRGELEQAMAEGKQERVEALVDQTAQLLGRQAGRPERAGRFLRPVWDKPVDASARGRLTAVLLGSPARGEQSVPTTASALIGMLRAAASSDDKAAAGKLLAGARPLARELLTETRDKQDTRDPSGNTWRGLALIATYRELRIPEALKAAEQAAARAIARPLAASWRRNALAVWLLAETYGLSQQALYLDAALRKLRLGVMPGQLRSGRWADPQDASLAAQATVLHAMIALEGVLPRHHPRRGALQDAVKRGLHDFVKRCERGRVESPSWSLRLLAAFDRRAPRVREWRWLRGRTIRLADAIAAALVALPRPAVAPDAWLAYCSAEAARKPYSAAPSWRRAVQVDPASYRADDGDSFTLAGVQIRLAGVDCPEIKHPEHGFHTDQPMGRKALAFTDALMKKARSIRYLPLGTDKYKRVLAHVLVDGRLLSARLIEARLAYPTAQIYGDSGTPGIAAMLAELARVSGKPEFEAPWKWRRANRKR